MQRKRLLLSGPLSPPDIPLLRNGKLSTLALRQGNPRLRALTNDEDVRHPYTIKSVLVSIFDRIRDSPRSECPIQGVLHVHNIETTNVLLAVNNDARPTHVATTSDHDNVTSVKLNKVGNLALLNVKLNSVINLDGGVGITDRTTVVGDDVWDAFRADGHFADFEELVGSFLGGNAVDREAALDIVE